MFYLEEHRNLVSEWKDFLDLQPKVWTADVAFWTQAELRLLRGSELRKAIPKMRDALVHEYELIAEKIPDF